MSYHVSAAGNRVYTKFLKTATLKEIIAYAKSKGSSMTASTAAIYEQLGSMSAIKTAIDQDRAVLKAIAPSRVALPKKLAEETVKRYKKK